MNFLSCGGFHYKFLIFSTSSFTQRRILDGDTPPTFRLLLQENDRGYDAQNFKIFISHHYVLPHLKEKESMTCCGAYPRGWHGIGFLINKQKSSVYTRWTKLSAGNTTHWWQVQCPLSSQIKADLQLLYFMMSSHLMRVVPGNLNALEVVQF